MKTTIATKPSTWLGVLPADAHDPLRIAIWDLTDESYTAVTFPDETAGLTTLRDLHTQLGTILTRAGYLEGAA